MVNHTDIFYMYNMKEANNIYEERSAADLEREGFRTEVKELISLIHDPELLDTRAFLKFSPMRSERVKDNTINVQEFMNSIRILCEHKGKEIKSMHVISTQKNHVLMLRIINECCEELGYEKYYIQGLPYHSEGSYKSSKNYGWLKPVSLTGYTKFKKEILYNESYLKSILVCLIPVVGQIVLLYAIIHSIVMYSKSNTKELNTY